MFIAAPVARPFNRRPVIMGTPTPNRNATLWESLTVVPALQSASLDANTITATYTQRDLVTATKRTFTTTYSPPGYCATQAAESPKSYRGHDGSYLRFPTVDDKTYLEVWTSHGLESNRRLPHGKLYTDEWFAGVAVSPDGDFVAYVAEPSATETEWSKRELLYDASASDPLGETYTDRRGPRLFVHHFASGRTVQAVDGEIHPGQPVWHGTDLIFTIRSATVRDMLNRFGETAHDLGVRFCYNRHSQIGVIRIEGKGSVAMESLPANVTVLSKGELCCFLPRVCKHSLIYFATLPGSHGLVPPHNSTKVLRHIDLERLSEPKTLIPIPQDPQDGEFPGLYVTDLPEEPWLDDNTIVFSSVWGSINRLLAARVSLHNDEKPVIIDLIMKARELFTKAGLDWVTKGSIRLLDARDSNLLIGASDPVTPTQLLLLNVKSTSITNVTPITTKSEHMQSFSSHLQQLRTVDLVALRPNYRASFSETAREFAKDSGLPSERFQVTILRPGRNDKRHLIVFPHGGPHVSTLNEYRQSTMALLQKGYTVSYINYRGSLGLGEKSLSSLPGNIGTQDVNEVVQATRWALKTYDLTGASFVGGSHSGFLGAHTSLIPGLFRGTVLRNPVVDLPSMHGGTDIPDWCFCEIGASSTPGFIASAEMLEKMYKVSPVAFVNECNEIGKTLLQLGKADRRVPVGQGLLWRRVLNGRFGEVCDIRFYSSSGHSIDEVPEGDDAWVAALDFLDATVTSPPTECLHTSHRKA